MLAIGFELKFRCAATLTFEQFQSVHVWLAIGNIRMQRHSRPLVPYNWYVYRTKASHSSQCGMYSHCTTLHTVMWIHGEMQASIFPPVNSISEQNYIIESLTLAHNSMLHACNGIQSQASTWHVLHIRQFMINSSVACALFLSDYRRTWEHGRARGQTLDKHYIHSCAPEYACMHTLKGYYHTCSL